MQFKIEIDCDNDAFGGSAIFAPAERHHEIARILRKLADDVEAGMAERYEALRDINGNLVGRAYFEEA